MLVRNYILYCHLLKKPFLSQMLTRFLNIIIIV
ncbi:hypothetical protein DQT32_04505 [Salmonella enterica subsp. enterica serovar Braenderup]|nr:hypothetical protein [Salmonella enterica subsp. enterica serovar Braenderup]